MTNYKLVNPLIDGNIKTSVKASSELKAAGKIYEHVLSPLFLTSAKTVNFTVEGDGKYFHYTAKETVNGDGDKAKFTITKFDGTVNDEKFKQQFNEIKKEGQSGGKSKHRRRRKDDDSSSSSSSSSDSPSYYSISRYYYSPYIYTPYVTTGTSYTVSIPIMNPIYALANTTFNLYGFRYI
jgi:hypothetical protein